MTSFLSFYFLFGHICNYFYEIINSDKIRNSTKFFAHIIFGVVIIFIPIVFGLFFSHLASVTSNTLLMYIFNFEAIIDAFSTVVAIYLVIKISN